MHGEVKNEKNYREERQLCTKITGQDENRSRPTHYVTCYPSQVKKKRKTLGCQEPDTTRNAGLPFSCAALAARMLEKNFVQETLKGKSKRKPIFGRPHCG
jgi:hypothetical protein